MKEGPRKGGLKQKPRYDRPDILPFKPREKLIVISTPRGNDDAIRSLWERGCRDKLEPTVADWPAPKLSFFGLGPVMFGVSVVMVVFWVALFVWLWL